MSDDLVTWLRAQLDEDERVAREAHDENPGPWRLEDDEPYPDVRDASGGTVVTVESGFNPPGRASEVHIARNHPTRVLAEVESKRRILDLHRLSTERIVQSAFDPDTGDRRPVEWNVECAICGWAGDDPASGCDTLRLLALPYADRDGYRQEWRP